VSGFFVQSALQIPSQDGNTQRLMRNDLLHLFNLDSDDSLEESLRLAMMFKPEVDEATRAYMDMLQLTIDGGEQTQENISQAVQETINAALLTGIRAYRSWIQSQGVDVEHVEERSGKDIPRDFFHSDARWPL
jgi:hypothetical protein